IPYCFLGLSACSTLNDTDSIASAVWVRGYWQHYRQRHHYSLPQQILDDTTVASSLRRPSSPRPVKPSPPFCSTYSKKFSSTRPSETRHRIRQSHRSERTGQLNFLIGS